MGILDFLDKGKRAAKKVETNIKKLTNPYRQTEERMQCAEELAMDGREEAVYGLLRRFTIKASNQVVDEDEKKRVYDLVLDLGEDAIPALRKFIQREDQLRYPLRALTTIVGKDEVARHVGDALTAIGPDYIKNPEPKLHLVQLLAEHGHDSAPGYLIPFLDDHDETIRFQTVQALSAHPTDAVREALWDRLLEGDEESLRTKTAVAEALVTVDGQHIVPEERRDAVREALPEGWVLDQQARIKRPD